MTVQLVSGGMVVGPRGTRKADVLVENEVIVAVDEPGTLTADQVIDATGLYVLPGLVDAHVHVRDPGLTHKEDFESATRAAVAGGVTTILVMPFDVPVAASVEDLKAKAEVAAGRIHADVALQAAIGSDNRDAIPGLVAAGAVSLELLLGVDPATNLTAVSDAEVRALFRSAAHSQGIVGVSCESYSLVDARTTELQSAGRLDPSAFIESRAESGEAISVVTACALALETGARIHIRQVSLPWSVDIIQHYRAEGADISFEVTPHNLILDAQREIEGGGPLKVVPPFRDRGRVDELQRRLSAGSIPIVATDHAPHTWAEKTAGDIDIWKAPGGLPGVETLLPAMLALCGIEGLETIARVCAEEPARRFGLGNRKGRIEPGMDADLVLIDPSADSGVTPSSLNSRAGYTPFNERELAGRVAATMLRGALVARDRVVGGPPRGEVLFPRWLT